MCYNISVVKKDTRKDDVTLMTKKEYKLVIDTETLGGFHQPIAYDVGGAVTDRNGHIYETFHFAVKETIGNVKRMNTAYYADKYPEYLERLYNHEMVLAPFADICEHINALIDKYAIQTLAAYNLQFDLRAMKYTALEILGTEEWTRADLKPLCIWCAACEILYTAKFCKVARENGWTTEKGNICTNAEVGFRYISQNWEFLEEHRGLDDVLVEVQILTAVYRKHKRFSGEPKAFPFRQVWKREKVEKGA